MTKADLLEAVRRGVHNLDIITTDLKQAKEVPDVPTIVLDDDLRMGVYHLDEARSHLLSLHFILSQEDHD